MIKLRDILKELQVQEGVNDPSILKAVFLAGGPGSGKSTVAKNIFGMPTPGFTTQGLKNVNSDRFFEFMLKKHGLSSDLASMSPEDFERTTVGPDSPRGKAKSMYKTAEALYLGGRLGLIIDGTGDDVKKIQAYSEKLQKEFGYDTYMVFVNTPMEVALERNNNRERKLPKNIVEDSWKEAQKAKEFYKKVFGNRFIEVVNDKSTPKGQPLDIDPKLDKAARKFVSEPVKNPIGLKWIEDAKAAAKLREAEFEDGRYHPEMPSVKIFCDMDGVLADFVAQWKDYYGDIPNNHLKKMGKAKFDEILDKAPYDFWAKMPWMPKGKGGEDLWKLISKHDTEILSAPAESWGSKKGKADWLKSKGINVKLNLKKARDKQQFAAPNHILIDDFKRNIDQWEAAGGIGILHKDNATTFRELKKYGIV